MGAGYFSCLDLKVGFWQITMDGVSKLYTAFAVENLGFLGVNKCPLGCAMPPQPFRA